MVAYPLIVIRLRLRRHHVRGGALLHPLRSIRGSVVALRLHSFRFFLWRHSVQLPLLCLALALVLLEAVLSRASVDLLDHWLRWSCRSRFGRCLFPVQPLRSGASLAVPLLGHRCLPLCGWHGCKRCLAFLSLLLVLSQRSLSVFYRRRLYRCGLGVGSRLLISLTFSSFRLFPFTFSGILAVTCNSSLGRSIFLLRLGYFGRDNYLCLPLHGAPCRLLS